MTEEEARLALLQTELSSIQEAIRGFDSTSIQVKGWCVTASLAIGGFAAAYRKPELLIVGLAAVVGFYLVNCQFNMIQRRFLKRNDEIDAELKIVGIMQFLQGQGTLDVTGAGARAFLLPEQATSVRERVVRGFPDFYFEARRVNTFSLYLFVGFCLLVELIIMLS